MRRILCSSLLIAIGACTGSARPDPAAAESDRHSFDWLTGSPQSPTFAVRDTESSLGPYAERAKTIDLDDLVLMHGHACDGLVVAAAALSLGLGQLYPDGIIDRTDTGCITNNSPCFGDAAAYLTGGRIRFGTQKIDPERGMSFVVHRFTTGETVEVELRDGVFPEELRALEARLRTEPFTIRELRDCQARQWEFARALLQRPLAASFEVRRLEGFTWVPDEYPHRGPRGDVLLRSATSEAEARMGR